MSEKIASQIAPDNLKLAVVMVGLPARGKSYTARRIERYLSWLGYRTRVFNVGEYRRARVGAQVPHSFFDPDNPSGEQARRSVAMAALDDMVSWLASDGQVAIYDATNTTCERRRTVRARCERSGFQVLFIEIRCDDPSIIEANIRATKLSSPDYEDADPDDAAADFRARIAHYQRVYQPLEDDEGVVTAGNYVWRPAGSRHDARAPGGCVTLSFFLKPNRFFDSAAG